VEALHDHTNGNGKDSETDRKAEYRDLLSRKTMQTETAMQLIEAAFTLGMEVGRSPARAPGARRLRERSARIAA
jgi:plasmid stability protein